MSNPTWLRCPICDGNEVYSAPAVLSPFLRERCRLPETIRARSHLCDACEHVFFTPFLSDKELGHLYTGHRGTEYNEMRVALEPNYIILAREFADLDSHYYRDRRSFYDDFAASGSEFRGLVVDAGEGSGYFGRYAYPRADVVTLSRGGATPGVVLPDLMVSADVLFVAQTLQQMPKPVSSLHRLTRWMRAGSKIWLDVPAQYLGSLRENFLRGAELADRGTPPSGPLWTLDENLSHFSPESLRRLCEKAGLTPFQVFKSDTGILGVVACQPSEQLGEPTGLAEAGGFAPVRTHGVPLFFARASSPKGLPVAPTVAAGALQDNWDRLASENAVTRLPLSPMLVVETKATGILSDDAGRLRAELERRDRELTEVYASTSWRMTAWLRRLVSYLRPTAASPEQTAPMLELDARLELSDAEADAFLPRGFSGAEAWGRWTDGPAAVFLCQHAASKGDGELEVWTHMVWGREGIGATKVSASVNGGRRIPLVVQLGRATVIPLSASVMAEPKLQVVFHISDPKRPEETPTEDGRRLGLGLSALRLGVIGLSPIVGA